MTESIADVIVFSVAVRIVEGTLFYSSDFITVVLTIHFKSDNWNEKLLKYAVKEVGGFVERKSTSSSNSLQFVGHVTCSGPINSREVS
jgi:hypothetical protein